MPEYALDILKLLFGGVLMAVAKVVFDWKGKKVDDRAEVQKLLQTQLDNLQKYSQEYQTDADDYRDKYWAERAAKHDYREVVQIFVWKCHQCIELLRKLIKAEECLNASDVDEARKLIEEVEAKITQHTEQPTLKSGEWKKTE